MPNDCENPVVEVLIQNHQRFLAFLISRVGDKTTAEDILQSAYLRGLERSSQLQRRERATAWFYRILRNGVIDHYRRNATHAKAAEELGRDLQARLGMELKLNVCQCIGEVVSKLKADYAMALTDVDLEGSSVEEFARRRSISPNNASVRLHRARKALYKELLKVCGVCAEHRCIDCSCR